MRPTFLQAFNTNISSLSQSPSSSLQILTIQPETQHQRFFQTLINISILNNKQQLIGQILKLMQRYQGSYSTLILQLKYISYSMQKSMTTNYQQFNILKLLAKWVDIFEGLNKSISNKNNKNKVKLYTAVIEKLEKGLINFEELIVFVNYISLDLMKLLKSEPTSSNANNTNNTATNNNNTTTNINTNINNTTNFTEHLDSQDLISFLSSILPKVLYNISVPRTFFPQTLLRKAPLIKSTIKQNQQQQQFIDILYSNQNLQNLILTKPHYIILIKNMFKTILTMQLQLSQIKQLIINSFNYYYLLHNDKVYGASQIIIQCFKKMNNTVRYAINQEIVIFINVIKKLGKQLFINYLSDKFQWFLEILKKNSICAINKGLVKPFYNKSQLVKNSQQFNVAAGKVSKKYIEIYERFSLLCFSLDCIQNDITIKFYYLGKFNKSTPNPKKQDPSAKKLLFSLQKKQHLFQGSIEAIQPGIYMFEFDNSYSWLKNKIVLYDVAILAPLEIKEKNNNKKSGNYGSAIKDILFEKKLSINQVPYENIIGWIDQEEIRLQARSGNVTIIDQNGRQNDQQQQQCSHNKPFKIYNLKLQSNTGNIYEYQSEYKNRFLKKLNKYQNDSNIYWMANGEKVNNFGIVRTWLVDGYLQKQKQNQEQTNGRLGELDGSKYVMMEEQQDMNINNQGEQEKVEQQIQPKQQEITQQKSQQKSQQRQQEKQQQRQQEIKINQKQPSKQEDKQLQQQQKQQQQTDINKKQQQQTEPKQVDLQKTEKQKVSEQGQSDLHKEEQQQSEQEQQSKQQQSIKKDQQHSQ